MKGPVACSHTYIQPLVKQLIHLLSSLIYLCDIGQPNGIGHNANTCNENLSSSPEQPWEFIHQSSDEALHCAELQTTLMVS